MANLLVVSPFSDHFHGACMGFPTCFSTCHKPAYNVYLQALVGQRGPLFQLENSGGKHVTQLFLPTHNRSFVLVYIFNNKPGLIVLKTSGISVDC